MSAAQTLEEPASPTHSNKRARGGRRSLVLLVGLVLGWTLLMRQFGGADVYGVVGPYAITVLAVAWLLRARALRSWLEPSLKSVLVGVVSGVVMTIATYPVFRLAIELIPGLNHTVESLYAASRTTTLPVAMAWVSAIVLAEEVLWRGVLLDALEHRMGARAALGLSVLSYALAQLGTGSWVVFALALVCGTLWTLERKLSDSLLAPLISHMIWTQTVILLYPVT